MSVCDLCNSQNVTTSIEEHNETSHGNFITFLDEFLAADIDNAIVAKDTIVEAIGKRVVDLAGKSDGGAAVFQQGLRVHDQLSNRVAVANCMKKGCELFVFGSCVSMGCWDGKGDIDFTLIHSEGWVDGTWPPEDEGGVIMKIASVLRACGFLYNDIEPVCRARVPVAKVSRSKKFNALNHSGKYIFTVEKSKCKPYILNEMRKHPNCISSTDLPNGHLELVYSDGETAMTQFNSSKCSWSTHPKNLPECLLLDFDMSCRAHGIRNSWFLRKYLEQSHSARIGNVFLKKWSKLSGVNNPKRGYLTSYAMSVLWVYYLLRIKHLKFIDPQSIPSDPRLNPKLTHIPLIPDNVKGLTKSIGELIIGFFKFYGHEFDAINQVVSLVREEVTTKESIGWTLDKEVHSEIFRDRVWYRFCVEDPYEANLSLGRHLSPVKASHIVAEFRQAYAQCLQGDLDGLLEDRSQTTVADSIQRVVGLIISEKGTDKCTILDVMKGIQQRRPSMLPAFEAANEALDILELCGLDHNKSTGVVKLKKAFKAKPDVVRKLLAQLSEGRTAELGIHLRDEHEVFNPRLFWLGASSRRLFTSRSAMEAFDEHFIEAQAVANLNDNRPMLEGTLKAEAAGRLSREVNDRILTEILNDKRFYKTSKAKGGEVMVQYAKTYVSGKYNHNIRDVTRAKYGKCDHCNARGPITGASDYLLDSGFYCDKCWSKY